jgi:3-hydroxy-9,10-secoandrosta-1,3,5(10)-triene-9,17-dione monooxygenase
MPVEGGYRVRGVWDYCSGADIGTHFLGGMMVLLPDLKVPRAYGYVLIDRKDYQIIDNWDVFGMQGTGSRRVVVDDMFVPSHRVLEMADMRDGQLRPIRNQPGRSIHSNPLYHGQYLPLLMFEVASVMVGGAKGAFDLYEQMMLEKKLKFPPFAPHFEMPDAQRRFGDIQVLIDTAEHALLNLSAEYTQACRREYVEGTEFSDEAARRMQRAQQHCIELAWQAIDLMFRSGGTSSATKTSMLGRYFRNLAVIRTHLSSSGFERYVQVNLCSASERLKVETKVLSIQFREPGTCVCESDPAVLWWLNRRRETIVGNPDDKAAVLASARYLDGTAGGLFAHAVADGILHQWLKNHVG